MEIDKIFNGGVDDIADNIFGTVNNSVSEVREMQKKKVAENVQLVIQALKKIESDLREQFGNVSGSLEKRILSIKDGKDGINGRDGKPGRDGKDGKDGKDGRPGRDGLPGRPGADGRDGVGVLGARIDFDGALIITLTNGNEINVGEVVAPDLAESIKVITNGGGTSQSVLDTLASLQAQISAIASLGAVSYQGTWNASTNTPTITSGSGTKGYYYVVSVAGTTSIDSEAKWGVGDWIVFNGTSWQKVDGGDTGDFTNLNVSGTATLSGGTANGVAYLNGSKVLTTGSALTFDGTNLGVGGIITMPNNVAFKFKDSGGTARNTFYLDASNNLQIQNNVNNGNITQTLYGTGAYIWNNSSTGLMSLTSTGLGIGTSSPGAKLEVNAGANTDIRVNTSASGYLQLGQFTNGAFIGTSSSDATAGVLRFGTGGTAQMRLDTSGNLGLGVTPSAWSVGKAIEVGALGHGIWQVNIGNTYLVSNVYYASSAYRYAADGYASAYEQSTGGHNWRVAASGLTGNAISFTQAMTLNSSGNLGIGTTSPGYKLDVSGTVNVRATTSGAGQNALVLRVVDSANSNFANAQYYANSHFWGYAGSANGLTLDSSGNLGLGVAPSAWTTYTAQQIRNASVYGWSGGNSFAALAANTWYGGSPVGYRYISTDFATEYYQYQGAHVWRTAASGTAGTAITFIQAMTLDANGNLGLGTTAPQNYANTHFITTDGTNGSGFQLRANNSAVSEFYATASELSLKSVTAIPLVFYTTNTERARIDSSGNLLIGTTTAGASKLVVNSDSIQVNTAKTPASATATGTTGQIAWDANYIYVCTATNTWKRAALATW